jgi:hypothetical protein
MARGRKADKGTYEAREFVNSGKFDLLLGGDMSEDCQQRLIKAVKFGLGIKEEEIVDVIQLSNDNAYEEQIEQFAKPIKEKKALKTSSNKDGDEYFAPEDCKEVGY